MGWVGSTAPAALTAIVVAVNLFNLDEEAKNPARTKGQDRPDANRKGKPKKDFHDDFSWTTEIF